MTSVGAAFNEQAQKIERLKEIIIAAIVIAEAREIPTDVTLERWEKELLAP
jgi:hypothetical protein